jgi:hypothetical protein
MPSSRHTCDATPSTPEFGLDAGRQDPHAAVPRKPFDVLVRDFAGAMGGNGEGKVTPLELFAVGIMELDAHVREMIREAA